MRNSEADQRARSVELLGRQMVNEAIAAAQARHASTPRVRIGRLMRTLAEGSGGQSIFGQDIARDGAGAEWERAAWTAESIPESLRGTGRFFAARKGVRDCALIDWDWVRAESTRAMGTFPGPKGGYMVGVDTLPAVDPLWQDSIIGATGVQTVEGLHSNVALPRGTSGITTVWQSADSVAPAAVDAPLGSVSISPKTVIATVSVSVQLARQSPDVNDFLARGLLRAVRAAFDNAMLQGTGASGQPQGLSNLPVASGLQQVSGTSLAWAGILNAQRLAASSGVGDSRLTWVGAPTVRETLAARERIATSGRFIWDDRRIAGDPAIATPDAPASTLFVGDFSQAVLALFGPGIELRFDPANGFNGGLVAFQVLAMADIVFPQPAAFVRISSIT